MCELPHIWRQLGVQVLGERFTAMKVFESLMGNHLLVWFSPSSIPFVAAVLYGVRARFGEKTLFHFTGEGN